MDRLHVYSTSLQLFMRLRSYVALAVIGELAIQLVGEEFSVGGGLIFASVLVWAYLAFNAHAVLLLPDDRDKAADNTRVLGFALRTFGLGLLMLIPVIAMMILALSGSLSQVSLESDGWSVIAAIGLICALGFLLVFGYLGTLLPAFVADRHRGIGAALSRGASQFFWIAGHLITGPILLFAISMTLVVGGLNALEPDSAMLSEGYYPNIPVFVILTLAYLVQALGTVMTAWVLSNAFLRAEVRA